LSGLVFTFDPIHLPQSLYWPLATVRPLGAILLALAAFYLVITLLGKKEWEFKRWRFAIPDWRLSGAQLVIAAADWLLAGAVLYSLLPGQASMGFMFFLGIFLIAQLAGLISQVPGGLGVFESVLVLLTPPTLPAPQVLGALLV
jgi:uncharacterized membrane protein YbhN (UPF0104 family)